MDCFAQPTDRKIEVRSDVHCTVAAVQQFERTFHQTQRCSSLPLQSS
jgi:hypothetical protein